jgi:tRNA A-37 threonylcarbamoyl transferase component Bud32
MEVTDITIFSAVHDHNVIHGDLTNVSSYILCKENQLMVIAE